MLDIEKLNANYKKDPTNELMENLLSKMSIIDSLKTKEGLNNEIFNIDLPTHGVTDQKGTGACWIYSFLNYLRELVIYKTDMKTNFALSANYLTYYDKLEKLNYIMDKLVLYNGNKGKEDETRYILSSGIFDGANFNQLAQLIDKYGLVPSGVYHETVNSLDTDEINAVLNRVLGVFYLELLKGKNPEKLKEKHLQAAYNILTFTYGEMPTKFDFKYKDNQGNINLYKEMTPQSFYESLEIDILNSYVEVTAVKGDDKNKIEFGKYYEIKDSSLVKSGTNVRYLNLPINRVKRLMVKQLLECEPVCFNSLMIPYFEEGNWKDIYKLMDQKYGRFLSEDINKPYKLELKRDDIRKSHSIIHGHSMLLTGASDYEDKGKVNLWKVENSWGPGIGFDGYFTLEDDFMTKYLLSAIINKDFLSKNEQEIVNKRPQIRKKWN